MAFSQWAVSRSSLRWVWNDPRVFELKFLNFYEVYEYFRKIFLFLNHIMIFHLKKKSLLIFMKFMSIFGRFVFFLSYWFFISKNFFLWMFVKFEYFWKIFLFLSHILIFYLKKIFFINFHEVYEYFWKIFLFFESYWFFISKFFFYKCSWSLYVFLKDFSIFESYIDFPVEKKNH